MTPSSERPRPSSRPESSRRLAFMRKHRAHLVFPTVVLALALVAAACGSGSSKKSTTGTTQQKEAITIAAFNFSESAILANIYGKALQPKGYRVTFKPNLGTREVVQP